MSRLDAPEARARFSGARVARLATISAEGAPHLVPIVFAVVGDHVVFAVDHKPKTTRALRRLDNIAAEPRVALLVDEYDDDWSQLWWARADGVACVYADTTHPDGLDRLVDALVGRYAEYSDVPPTGPFVVVEVTRWSGWSASGPRAPRNPGEE